MKSTKNGCVLCGTTTWGSEDANWPTPTKPHLTRPHGSIQMRSDIFDTLARSLATKTTTSSDDSLGITDRLRPQTMHGGRGLGRLFGGGMTGHGHHHGTDGCGSHDTQTESNHRTEGDHEDTSETDDAFAILRERYARGEIDEEEFEQRKRVLRSKV